MSEPSILGQVRAEGYRAGAGQMSMICQDEAFERGRLEGEFSGYRRARRDRAIYWFVGLIMGGFGAWWMG